jgi:hypothetical protein
VVLNVSSDKRFGLVDVDQTRLDGNVTVGRVENVEAPAAPPSIFPWPQCTGTPKCSL